MSVIRQDDFISSVADALQFISYYHPLDFIQGVHEAYLKEENPAAKDAMAQILINSRMCAEGKRPICQDTGIVTVFLKVGMNVQWDSEMNVTDMVNEGVRQAYMHPDNVLRASILADPAGKRQNTKDNTPAVIHYEIVEGDQVEVHVAAKGGGSENKSKMVMLNPSDSIVDWIVKTVPTMGAGWCPPGMLGIGIGGTAEKAAVMAKESLMEPMDIHELRERGPQNRIEELRLEIMDAVNELGIGAQGLGGLTTIMDVKIMDYPTHAASLPVCMIPNCAATRHTHFTLDGTGPAVLTPPNLDDWPEVTFEVGAHKRMIEMLDNGEELPVDLKGRFIYYVGPVDPVEGEVVGPAGPTTATRMDKFTRQILESTGLLGMIGKSERGPMAIEAIKDNEAVYLMAVGGAAYLVSKAITASKVLAFPEMGMEAIYEFEVKDMPVTVAVNTSGESVHTTGPAKWKDLIAKQV